MTTIPRRITCVSSNNPDRSISIKPKIFPYMARRGSVIFYGADRKQYTRNPATAVEE